MLKFLTHKLKTQSINEENAAEKADENHDSGTESDDETEDQDFVAPAPLERVCSISPADTGCSMESPAPDPQDPHSSEEELEVINNSPRTQPEKRKWSQVGDASSSTAPAVVVAAASSACRCSPENEENSSRVGNAPAAAAPSSSASASSSPCCARCRAEEAVGASSDEEVHSLLASMATPVRFRTSPPLEALKPGRPPGLRIRTASPPAKQLHYEVSPRKRSRHARHAHMPRPFLDFEKMQQLTAWSHTADHGGELSVFCW